ncbi:RING-H2 finger protein ATL30 [Amborella trichopoda]|uniref:RING-type E3 ubiquitin transferase n=1 Tax=Amborella trichopoda TaxID=13333 RepID=W1NVG3_AMBTC|nr:RING-H2 finger protein ATL30 [Amborella trichopoda]ERM98654.1 hypothetical protein AMTR_s00109p00108980 [Amborella trichopoda]|eukprot:XP_006833376.1 RING-H2 finger protein ATL30 [Amborella trichopoda]
MGPSLEIAFSMRKLSQPSLSKSLYSYSCSLSSSVYTSSGKESVKQRSCREAACHSNSSSPQTTVTHNHQMSSLPQQQQQPSNNGNPQPPDEEPRTNTGLAPEVISNFPTSKIGTDTVPSPYFSKNNDCVICFEGFLDDEVVKELQPYLHTFHVKELQPCLHAFHGDCVDKWLGRDNRCPSFRGSLIQP